MGTWCRGSSVDLPREHPALQGRKRASDAEDFRWAGRHRGRANVARMWGVGAEV